MRSVTALRVSRKLECARISRGKNFGGKNVHKIYTHLGRVKRKKRETDCRWRDVLLQPWQFRLAYRATYFFNCSFRDCLGRLDARVKLAERGAGC